MREFNDGRGADPHANGTIWGAALWDFRSRLREMDLAGGRLADLIVLRALTLMGASGATERNARARDVRAHRRSFGAGLAALIEAETEISGGAYGKVLLDSFAARGIDPQPDWPDASLGRSGPSRTAPSESAPGKGLAQILRRIAVDDIPADEDLVAADLLADLLSRSNDHSLSLLAGGDVMLGGRGRKTIEDLGLDYPFAAVRPLLARSPIVMANLEGPFAAQAKKVDRQFSYRVRPAFAAALPRSGINVVSLANNHLVDCGRDGVLETLETLRAHGVAVVGAGANRIMAHSPVILSANGLRIGILGYYWNRRCAATKALPGSAMDPPQALERDISALRAQVDRVVVTFHWGVPYERVPSADDRAKARFAVECGADAVIGHHPHVLQPFEIHQGRPIFYSVGNFAFGSGNSRAEGCLVGIRFEPWVTTVTIYPIYVRNRDPRVNYQPKVLRGKAARRSLLRVALASGSAGKLLEVSEFYGSLVIPRAAAAASPARTGTNG